MSSKLYYLYILECSNNAYYTGYTTDIKRRYEEHQAGTSKCKYTRSFPPTNIAACWEVFASLSDVLKIERLIKSLSKLNKASIIRKPESLVDILISREILSGDDIPTISNYSPILRPDTPPEINS